MERVPLLVASGVAETVFPGAFRPLTVSPERRAADLVIGSVVGVFCPRDAGEGSYRVRADELHAVGCLARVVDFERTAHDVLVLEGQRRVRLCDVAQPSPLEGLVDFLPIVPDGEEARVRADIVRDIAIAVIEEMPDMPYGAATLIRDTQQPGALADLLISNSHISFAEAVAMLATLDAAERLAWLLPVLVRHLEPLELRRRIDRRVASERTESFDRRQVIELERRAILDETLEAAKPAEEKGRGIWSKLFGREPSLRDRIGKELQDLRRREQSKARSRLLAELDQELTLGR
jgi:Lon protease-like protein